MSFTDELQKKFLPAASTYIKARERDYQEITKRLALINKEIATLRNPRNLSRARGSSSYGEMSRLLGRYEKFQIDADKANKKTKEQINTDLDNYADAWNNEYGAVTTDAAGKAIGNVISEINSGGYNFERLKAYLASKDLFNEEKEPSERTFFALLAIKNRLNNEEDKAKIDGVMADLVKQKYPTDDRFRGQTSIDPQAWLSKYYPDLSTTSEAGRKNREAILSRPQAFKGAKGVAGAFHDQDVSEYKDYSKQITKYKGVLDGLLADQGLLSRDVRPEQVSEFAQKISPIEEVDGKIAFKEDADPEEVAVFKKILADEGLQEGSDYSKFLGSNYVTNSMTGLMSPNSTKRMMEKRAQELEQQRDALIQHSVRDENLSPAQIAVLNNPLFTRTNFRRGPSLAGIGSERPTMPSVSASRPAPVEAAPEAAEAPADATEAPAEDVSTEDSGVPVIPGIINRIERAAKRAKDAETTSDATVRMEEFADVLEEYEDLPDSVKDRFPTDFNEAVDDWLKGFDTKGARNTPSRMNLEWENRVTKKGLLDRTPVTTMTVGQLVSRTNEAEYENTKRVLGFLDNPDSLGQNAAEGTDPLGTVGSDFLDASANKFQGVQSIIDRSKTIPEQGPRGEYFDPKYGSFASVDRFLGRMDGDVKDQLPGDDPSRFQANERSEDQPPPPPPKAPTPPPPPTDFMSEFQLEQIAEMTEEPQDEAPEAEIPELKSAEQSMAEQRAIAKAQQEDYEASTPGAKAYAATAPRVDQDSYRHDKTPMPKQKAATLDDDAVVRDAFATMEVPAETPAPTPAEAPTPPPVETPTIEPDPPPTTAAAAEPTTTPTGGIDASLTAAELENLHGDLDQPSQEQLTQDSLAAAQKAKTELARRKGEEEKRKAKELADAKAAGVSDEGLVITEPEPTPVLGAEVDDDVARQRQNELQKASVNIFNKIDSGEFDFDAAIKESNKINESYSDIIGPNYNMKMLREIAKRFDKPVDQPESKPEEPVTKVAKLGFVSPVKTKDTIDGAQVITSAEFGPRPDWKNPGKVKDHKGIDLRAKLGEPVFSVADGVVIKADRTDDDGNGLNVSIRHADGSVTKYFHASAITEGLEVGTEVKAGQEIMKSGSTGNSEAPHLHLELHKPNDKGELVAVNPLENMGDLFSDFVIKKTGKTVAETYNTKVAGQGALPK